MYQQKRVEGNAPTPEDGSVYTTHPPPDRSSSSSAPPALELSSESLFAFTLDYAKIFTDIRTHEDYNDFYESYEHKDKKLPPPLETHFLESLSLEADDESPAEMKKNVFLPQQPAQPNSHAIMMGIPAPKKSSNLEFLKEMRSGRLSSTTDSPYSSSPSTQTAYSIANFVWKDEESNYSSDSRVIPEALHGSRSANYFPKHDQQFPKENGGNFPHPEFLKTPFPVRPTPQPYPTSKPVPTTTNSFSSSVFPPHMQAHNPVIVAPQPSRNPPNLQIPVQKNGVPSQFRPPSSPNNNINGQSHMNLYPSNHSSSPVSPTSSNIISSVTPSNSSGVIVSSSPTSTTTNSSQPQMAQTVCRYFANGYCNRGEKCFYSHDLTAEPSQQSTSSSAPKSNPNTTPKKNTPLKTPTTTTNNPKHPPSLHPSPMKSPSGTHPRSPLFGPPETKVTSPEPESIPIATTTTTATITSPLSKQTQPQSLIQPQTQPQSQTQSQTQSQSQSQTQNQSQTQQASSSNLPLNSESFYTSFENVMGKIYLVSKDQQGCRFLQKKLEEKDAKVIQTIFSEVYQYVNELMTDPFGNYLCQKLLEHCNDEQKYLIVEKVAPDLVNISKNMHGTRAVQKMIEFLSTPAQVELVKKALKDHVVQLIQDLNGNHVIQRCLNCLSPEDDQFIYDSVTSGNNCVAVATHRHGCCVLQRCIDHASEPQKVQLIQEIIKNALPLVQDPYGNYVVQYVLELPFPNLVENLVKSFLGNIAHLATQKFSSNVIEKCLGVVQYETRKKMVDELLEDVTLLAMLQDPFANYVIQTALSVADQNQHLMLVEAIKPHLTQLRNTPYGKRIMSKITKETLAAVSNPNNNNKQHSSEKKK